MNISQWLNRAGAFLAERRPGAGRTDAEALLCRRTGKDRAALYRDGLEEIPPGLEEDLRGLLARRAGGEPLAYITGHREFMGLDFAVSPEVLIPRPETELLVEKALEILKERRRPGGGGQVAVDVGTGSGAIAVSLAALLEGLKVYATDISPEALEVAGKNAARHGVRDRVDLLPGDLLAPLLDIPGLRADLVAANLPYVPAPEIDGLMAEVRDHEPRGALDGGPDGLDHYRRLVPQARRLLRPGGNLLIEIAPDQGAALKEILGGWEAEVFPDLAGRERLVSARRPEGEKPGL